MCGIAGFLNFPDHRSMAFAANALQRHRGPDAHGVWSIPELSLAHRRLSIIDLSNRSNQPLEKGGLVIVFNGEIYNYKSLKRRLEDDGVAFATDSDTEVVLELFRRYREKCLDLLKGMFAFAIWAQAEKRLFLARDPFGIKPLYYHKQGPAFAFGSELKTLAAILPVERRVSPRGLAALLSYLWLPPDFCILEDFRSVPPGHHLTTGPDGAVRLERYWALPCAPAHDGDERELVEQLGTALEQSVERHMVADVEVGAFLSGGLDSSLLCAMAGRHVRGLRTFTIGTDPSDKKVERMPSDERFARRVAERLGTNHREIVIAPKIIEDLPRMLGVIDEPLGDPAALNTYLICAGARGAGIKVLLSGMGADEVFFGYRRQKAWLLARRYQAVPRVLRRMLEGAIGCLPVRVGARGVRSVRWAKKFLTYASLGDADRYRMSFSYYSPDELRRLIDRGWHAGIDSVAENFRRIFGERYEDDPVNRLCFTDINLFLPGLNLAYTDRASMAASTEVRVPFVDRDVVELAMRIRGPLKFRNGESKYILKKVAEKYLPNEITYRPKASFGAPLRAWISRDLRPMVDELLSFEIVRRRGWVDPVVCREMIESDRKGLVDFSYQIYQLLVLELWAQSVLDGPRAKTGLAEFNGRGSSC